MTSEKNFNFSRPPSSNIVAVAVRIQDRATQLASEQSALELSKLELENARSALRKQERDKAKMRKALLEATLRRHEAELDIQRLNDDKDKIEKKNEKIKDQVDQNESENQQKRAMWDDKARTVYVKHIVEMDVALRHLEHETNCHDAAKQERDELLRELATKTEAVQQSIISAKARIDQLQSTLLRAELKEDEDDEEAAAVALQIKSTLAKKTAMRDSLHSLQEKLLKMNETLLQKESECLALHDSEH